MRRVEGVKEKTDRAHRNITGTYSVQGGKEKKDIEGTRNTKGQGTEHRIVKEIAL